MIRRGFLLLPSLLLACGSSSGSPDGGPASDAPTGDDPGDPGDAVCSSLLVDFRPVVPSVMLVVDRSGSMKADYGGPTRWQALYGALMDPATGIVAQLADEVRFGLLLYSGHDLDPDGPCPTLHEVAPALGNHGAIDGLYAGMQPGEGTPSGAAVRAATPMLEAVDADGPKLMILATDGIPDTCAAPSEDSSAMARQQVIGAVNDAYDGEISTYVIGVGPDVSSEHLQEVANAGRGLAPTGPQNAVYYRANDTQALVAAFDEIINGARGCVFELDTPVDPDIAEGVVTLDGEELVLGTDWQLRDGGTLELIGAACDIILAGGEHTVEATFTCPNEQPDAGNGGVE